MTDDTIQHLASMRELRIIIPASVAHQINMAYIVNLITVWSMAVTMHPVEPATPPIKPEPRTQNDRLN